jgi:hypothetical protein
MSIEEARWTSFLESAGIPHQHKPLQFTEEDTGATLNQHTPTFLLQYPDPIWLEVLPVLTTDALYGYTEILHFARTTLMVDEQERSEYWPVSVDCVFAAFGSPGAVQSRYAGTYPILVLGSKDNPKPVIGCPTIGYAWAECCLCHRVTLCMDFGDSLGDFSGSAVMSCCGQVFDERTRPIRNSQRLRQAIATAKRTG